MQSHAYKTIKFSFGFSLLLLALTFIPATMNTNEPQAASKVSANNSATIPPHLSLNRASRDQTIVYLKDRPVSLAVSSSTTPVPAPPSTAANGPSSQTIVTPPAPTTVQTDELVKAATGDSRDNVVDIAIAQLGKAYRTGATGPNAFDCSGFVYWVFNQAGIHAPRLTSDGYYNNYPHVNRSDLQPGDVAVYRGHIAIYVGNGQIVAASTPRGGVKRESMTAPGAPYGFARL